MLVKEIIAENFQDYKKISMFICANSCDGKCWREQGLSPAICQNDKILCQKTISIPNEEIVEMFMSNHVSEAIIFGGLEPLLQIEDVVDIIRILRDAGDRSDVVVYTGYKLEESPTQNFIQRIRESNLPHVLLKVGRYIPNDIGKFDEILGVRLASQNQFGYIVS